MADLSTDSTSPTAVATTDPNDDGTGKSNLVRFSQRVKTFLDSLSPSGATAYDSGWTAYSATLSGVTNAAITSAQYRRVGMMLSVRVRVSFSGASVTSGSGLQVTLPFSVSAVGAHEPIGNCTFLDDSAAARFAGVLIFLGGGLQSSVVARALGTNGQHTTAGGTAPFTWAAGDTAFISLTAPIA